jgi:diacylglycerol kinase
MDRLGCFFRGFKYAASGIVHVVASERNMRFHIAAVFYVVLFGIWQHLTTMFWTVELLCCALVLSLEMVNSALERLCDAVDRNANRWIGLCKDAAAGAVLVSAIGAAVIWVLILLDKPHLENLIYSWTGNIWPLLLFILSLPLAAVFIFYKGKKNDD